MNVNLFEKNLVAMKGKDPREDKIMEMPDDFVPGPKDIICGRGKKCYDHVGNRRFRVAIAMSLNRYQGAKTRVEKPQVVHAIVTQLRLSSPTGAFLKMNYVTRKWMTVSDAVAHEKVGHAIRDALSLVNESRMQSQFTQAKHNTCLQPKIASFKAWPCVKAVTNQLGEWPGTRSLTEFHTTYYIHHSEST